MHIMLLDHINLTPRPMLSGRRKVAWGWG